MSFSDFQSVLIPSKKTGALHFYHKPSKSILEAAFSRPNVGGTSGAAVFDKNGNLIELAENEPDWEFPIAGGCPRVLLRPQSQNLCTAALSVAAASKINVTIPNATSIREDGDLASEFFAFQDFSGYTSNTKYTLIIEVEPVGGRNFRLQEGLGSNAITNIDFNAETASGVATLIKQVNGKFLVFLPITTGVSQTAIRILMRILDDSLNAIYDGDVNKGLNITLRDIQTGHDNIFPIPNSVTRASNQVTFEDLIVKEVIGSNQFSLLVSLGAANASGNSGFRFFLSENSETRFAIYGMLDSGMRVYDFINSTYVSPNHPLDKAILITVDGDQMKVYYPSTGLYVTHSSALGVYNVNKLVGSAPNGYCEIQKMAFAPYCLTEAQAVAALSEI